MDENAFDEDEDIDKNVCDLRNMTKMIKSSRKDGVKRLQKGPRRAREATAQRKRTGNILRKLVERISQEIPEIKMGEETRRKHREKSKNMRDRQRDASSHEECLAMLGDMTIYKKATREMKVGMDPMAKGIEQLSSGRQYQVHHANQYSDGKR